MGDLPGEILTAADDKIFGVYQDWVHKNPRTHLDGGIEEDGKWQDRWKQLVLCPPNAMMYHLDGLETNLLGFFWWILMESGIANGTWIE